MRAYTASAAHRRRQISVALVVLAAGVLQMACGPAIDLKNSLQVETVTTGWSSVRADKVVPALSIKLKNVSDQKLVVLQVNLRFRSVDDVHEWGYSFLAVTGSAGLAPGAVTDTLVLKAPFGYVGTGADRRFENFAEAKVEVFARYASAPWTPIGEYPIARQLIDR